MKKSILLSLVAVSAIAGSAQATISETVAAFPTAVMTIIKKAFGKTNDVTKKGQVPAPIKVKPVVKTAPKPTAVVPTPTVCTKCLVTRRKR